MQKPIDIYLSSVKLVSIQKLLLSLSLSVITVESYGGAISLSPSGDTTSPLLVLNLIVLLILFLQFFGRVSSCCSFPRFIKHASSKEICSITITVGSPVCNVEEEEDVPVVLAVVDESRKAVDPALVPRIPEESCGEKELVIALEMFSKY
ncbi:hypothetical protein BDA99DRAFT_519221 [Phascolomyces articulosus]|uniref:Uncharacterized protein n=1 Tax=Phascolomyces articulosus TaxID=60185 RepID=A0AAD5K3X4_9FUNG|nr:hypothetical protein BDA99DRAFT_519221 [Phascolomyces articulosus]